jgi:hypothetical protein
MSDPRIPLKNPLVAGVLAFLVPGAGHFYQGRYFKALVYFVCITGLFLAGMRMSDWKALYLNKSSPDHNTSGRHTLLRFAAQFGVGLPSLWALVQRGRFYDQNLNLDWTPEGPRSFEYQGEIDYYEGEEDVPVAGRVELEPFADDFGAMRGRFLGIDASGKELDLELGGRVEIDHPVGASGRRLKAQVLAANGTPEGRLKGVVPRPFWNRFAAPLQISEERELHARLGKFHELAMVFTWVAGLLNLLAIWDAVEGPAYGYGDEPDSKTSGEAAESGKDSRSAEPVARSESAEMSPA